MAASTAYEKTEIQVDQYSIPVRVYREFRTSVRVSIGKSYAILRMPKFSPSFTERSNFEFLENWLRDKVLTQERYQQMFTPRVFDEQFEYQIMDRKYRINLVQSENKNHTAKLLQNNVIQINIGKGSDEDEIQRVVPAISSRVMAKRYQREIEKRVREINNQYFNKEIKSVRLKLNTTNWGSCSSSGNINLSTRLLFAPEAVRDYVIVHELAHLIEMNHGKNFWKIVEEIMPDYKQKERWLKENNHLCNF